MKDRIVAALVGGPVRRELAGALALTAIVWWLGWFRSAIAAAVEALVKKRPIQHADDDPKFCPAGRLICRGCGWNADGGPCANCGATAPDRDLDVQAWRELWGVR